jgi:hypothetical protein
MPLPDRPICNLPDKRKGTAHQIIGEPVATKPFTELSGLVTQVLIRQTGERQASFRNAFNHLSRKAPPDA